ncbi:MAG TPA: serine protein kinase RIO [Methanothrix sp.]|nr:serine protein kinase RIO [Methanothrix sp.]HRW82536.1 serine protein kinase RIO [Methanothrix sp.]
MTEDSKKQRQLDKKIDLSRERIKDSDDLKVQDEVFDRRALMDLYALASKGQITSLGGSVSTGKEANIFRGKGEDGADLAIKIYRINTSNFKAMQNYLQGDPRFGSIKGTKRAVVTAWTRKEYRNLKRAEEVGVKVPHPIAMRENILVMEMVGSEDAPAPQIKDVVLDQKEAEHAFEKIADYVSVLYNRANLVHADLSEFNILYDDGEPVIIDMGQSVTLDHPMARSFIERDISNLARYFKKRYGIGTEEFIKEKIRAGKEG